MKLKKVIKLEKEINDWWANQLSDMWECDYEAIHHGSMYDYADCVIGYDDVKFCVKEKVSFDDFLKWYDLYLDAAHKNKSFMNLKNYIRYANKTDSSISTNS